MCAYGALCAMRALLKYLTQRTTLLALRWKSVFNVSTLPCLACVASVWKLAVTIKIVLTHCSGVAIRDVLPVLWMTSCLHKWRLHKWRAIVITCNAVLLTWSARCWWRHLQWCERQFATHGSKWLTFLGLSSWFEQLLLQRIFFRKFIFASPYRPTWSATLLTHTV